MALAAASVFVFRALSSFILNAILPGTASPVPVIMGRLTSASAITAVCFAAAVVMAVLAFRSRAALRVAVFAAVISLGVSAALIVTLRDLSAHYQTIAAGGRIP